MAHGFIVFFAGFKGGDSSPVCVCFRLPSLNKKLPFGCNVLKHVIDCLPQALLLNPRNMK